MISCSFETTPLSLANNTQSVVGFSPIQTIPTEIHAEICSCLDIATSVLLGLNCKAFYQFHRDKYKNKPVSLMERVNYLDDEPSPSYFRPDRRYELINYLVDWFPKDPESPQELIIVQFVRNESFLNTTIIRDPAFWIVPPGRRNEYERRIYSYSNSLPVLERYGCKKLWFWRGIVWV